MRKNILPFPHEGSDTCHIPTPVNARPGDSFVHINVVDDKYARTTGFMPGAVLIARFGEVTPGFLHYVELRGYGFLARPDEASQAAIHLTPLDGLTPAGSYRRDDLNFIGAIVEIYPHGLDGSRWVLHPAQESDAVLPIVSAVAN